MYTLNQIQQMNKEELDAASKKLMKRLVWTNIVAPIAITAVVHIGLNYLVNKLDSDNEN